MNDAELVAADPDELTFGVFADGRRKDFSIEWRNAAEKRQAKTALSTLIKKLLLSFSGQRTDGENLLSCADFLAAVKDGKTYE